MTGTVSAANVSSGAFASNTGFGNFTFGTSTNPILHIDNANARVGIGTTNPAMPLHLYVNDSLAQQMPLRVEQASAAGDAGINFRLSDSIQWSMGIDNSDSDKFVIAYEGNFNDDLTKRMVITSGGNVGIGTAAPGYKLEVSGNALATEFYFGGAGGRLYTVNQASFGCDVQGDRPNAVEITLTEGKRLCFDGTW